MAVQLKTSIRNTIADALGNAVGTGAVLDIRSGAAPGIGTTNSGTLLATLTMNGTDAFGAAASGVATAGAITSDSSADATGTPGHFNLFDDASRTNCLAQGTCAVGSGDINFNATISLGGTVSISSFTITAGNP